MLYALDLQRKKKIMISLITTTLKKEKKTFDLISFANK